MDYALNYKDQTIEEMKYVSATQYRTIYLAEDVTEDSSFKAGYYLDRLYRNDKIEGTKEPIKLIISSYGGNIYSGLSIISRIERMIEEGYEIESIIDSHAMSMGSAISMVCNSRKALRYSTLLFHQPSSYAMGSLTDMITSTEETQRLWDVMKRLMKKHTKMSDDYIDNIFKNNRDVFMDSETALSLGIIDEII